MKFLKPILLIFLLLSFNNGANSAVNTALINGNWSNPSVWSNGVPSCGDIIVIPNGKSVIIDVQINIAGCGLATYIVVQGILHFNNGNKVELACGSGVEIFSGGLMTQGGGGGSSNLIKICNVTVWKAQDGNINGYGIIGTPAPLPVEFIEFSVKKNYKNFDFSWSVASERENAYFSIEYSLDGSNWKELVEVASIGDHTNGHIYNKTEFIEDFNFGVVYFRLSQTDKNGEITLLDVQSFENKLQEVLVYPNPAKLGDGITIALNSSSAQTTEVHLYNSLGQVVYNEVVLLTAGMNHITITPLNVNRGIYFVKIPSMSSVYIHRLIIK